MLRFNCQLPEGAGIAAATAASPASASGIYTIPASPHQKQVHDPILVGDQRAGGVELDPPLYAGYLVAVVDDLAAACVGKILAQNGYFALGFALAAQPHTKNICHHKTPLKITRMGRSMVGTSP